MISVWMILMACGEKESTNELFFDADSDGYRSDVDCDDGNAAIHPAAIEICDGIDNDCDQLLDEEDDSVQLNSFFVDADNDGFGGATEILACDAPENAVEDSSDCNDENPEVHPEALEVCDQIDNDCDQLIDDEDDSLDRTTGQEWYWDLDLDDFGTGEAFYACEAPVGAVEVAQDCDDSDPNTHPDAEEVCDEKDNNCNGTVDEQMDGLTQCDECTDTALPTATGELFSGVSPIGDEHQLECGPGGADTVSRWIAPATGVYTISSSSDAMAFFQDCEALPSECFTTGTVTREFQRNEVLQIVQEGSSFDLNIWAESELNCADGYDDDNDGLVDCDDEEDCWFDSQCGASLCPNFDLVDPMSFEVSNGLDLFQSSTFAMGDDYQASCFSAGSDDISYWYAPASNGCAEIFAYSDEVDISLAVYSSCGGDELDCNADSSLTTTQLGTNYGSFIRLQLQESESYIIVVDGVATDIEAEFQLGIDRFDAYDCDGNPLGN